MPKPIQAVIFDQDGLMFDTESLAAASWFEIGPKYGIHVDGNTPTAGLHSTVSR